VIIGITSSISVLLRRYRGDRYRSRVLGRIGVRDLRVPAEDRQKITLSDPSDTPPD